MRPFSDATRHLLALGLCVAPWALAPLAGCGDDTTGGAVAQVDTAAPGPAWIEVTMSPQRGLYDLGDKPSVRAALFDWAGQPAEGEVVWSVDPAGAAEITSERVRFLAEGAGWIRACVGDICGEAAFFVDDAAPLLEVSAPARGAALTGAVGDTILVTGEASDSRGEVEVRVNGVRAALDDAGAFSVEIEPEFGFNKIEVTADDGARAATRDMRDVLWSERYLTVDEAEGVAIPDAIALQLDQGALTPEGDEAGEALTLPEGAGTLHVSTLSEIIEATALLLDVDGLIPDPQLADSEALSLRVEAVNLGQPEVDAFFTDTGIELFLALPELEAQTSGRASAGGVEVNLEGTVRMGIAAYATLTLGFGDQLEVTLSDAGVAVGAIEGSYDDPAADALVNSIGGVAGELINGMTEDLITALLTEQLPDLVDEGVAALLEAMAEIPIELPSVEEGAPGAVLTFGLSPSRVTQRRREALSLGFDARLSLPPSAASPHADPGVPISSAETFPLVPSVGLALEVRLALINALLHELWRGGLLTLSPALPEGMSGLIEAMSIDAVLPPLVVLADAPEGLGLELQLGELRLSVDSTIGEGADLYSLSLRMPVTIDALGGKLRLSLPPDGLELSGTVIESAGEEALLSGEQIANLIVTAVWPEIQSALEGGLAFGLDPIALSPESLGALAPRLSGLVLTPELGEDLRVLGDRLRLEGGLDLQLTIGED